MSKLSKIVCLIVLCSFTFAVSASGIVCSLVMSDADTQQDVVDMASESCHSEQSKSSDESFGNCCQDMNSCGTSMSFISSLLFTQVQIAHSAVQLSSSEFSVFNISSPPERPPKLIS